MTRLIVIRHGHSAANNAQVFSGMLNTPLSAVGERQAEYLAEYLAANERIDKIYVSGLTRTVQTATPTAKRLGLPLHTERGFQEIFAGIWENVKYKKINLLYHDEWMTWGYDFAHARCPSGESVRAFYRRVEAALHRLCAQNENKTVMLVTHATPLRVLCCMANGGDIEDVGKVKFPDNASINVFHYENGTLTPEQINLVVYPCSLIASRAHPLPPRREK